MISKIKGMFDKRILVLLAVIAIGTSGMASMAALTGSLTVTSTFAGAQIKISGNGTEGTATLFQPGQVIGVGQSASDSLQITNTGNVAAHFTYTPPVNISGTGNLGSAMRVDLFNISAAGLANPTNIATALASCKSGGTAFLEVQQTAQSWTTLNVSAFDLNPTDSKYLCYRVTVPAGTNLDAVTDMAVEQHFTGNE